MTLETITHVRAALAEAGFTREFVVSGGRICVAASEECYAPVDVVVTQVVRFQGITERSEEGFLFALSARDGTPFGTYVPAFHPAVRADDARIVEELQQRVITEQEVRTHARHDHVAAVFDDRCAAEATADELRQLGLGSDQLGRAVREGAERAFERDAERDAVHDTELGVAAGAVVGLLAGMSVVAVALVPGGVLGLGGILALGVPIGMGGAVLGGYIGEALSERAFLERDELDAVPLRPGQILVAACGHGHREAVEAVMERHGGQLVLRATTD